ncbi:MAG TPA: DUF47 family protein [Candidatus Ventricola intestinavium]|nr:DUF47 family protein [Candidatus Ventricola intestinavium]
MAKNKNDYFEMIRRQTACCVQAASLLEDILCHFSTERIAAQREQMHEIEHTADKINHDIQTRLSTEFITPIDQEDILRLVTIIDDITDALDDVVLELYMYHVAEAPQDAAALAKVVSRCVLALNEAAGELRNFKKPEGLRRLLVRVNDIEGEGDALFMEAIHRLFDSSADCKTLLGHKAVYESLENCCDLCEHAADVIEQVIIKNT